jgi:hypothetical protein
MRRLAVVILIALLLALRAPAARAEFDLVYQVINTGNQFSAGHLQIINTALAQVERAWETAIIGYQPSFAAAPVVIQVTPTNEGLAAGIYSGLTVQGGFTFSTGGSIFVNFNEIDNFANWQGAGANGKNYIDELLFHETGHVLGIGTLWDDNGVYVQGSFHYTGPYGLAAYRAEFDPAANWVPVENAGDIGTMNAHWDQRMRSSVQEGTPPPANPYLLDPRVGVVDQYGRDRALEVMTGGIDADYGEPFVSRLTIESMRDMGYTVAKFEDANGDGTVGAADLAIWKTNFGATGLQIDSFAFGDPDRDRSVAGRDFLLWQRAASGGGSILAIPEPGGFVLAVLGVLGLSRRRRR